ncbi:hypothetical protein Sjap_010198 [Stephania japonica]|uniref:Uncharacterized protein n=1 Tax=Stephania japonica TaxID=461633 RepID=A0AAP0J907_9MAGN
MSTTSLSKPQFRNKVISSLNDVFVFVGGSMLALLLLWSFCSFVSPNNNTFTNIPNISSSTSSLNQTSPKPAKLVEPTNSQTTPPINCAQINLTHDPPDRTFYDDPTLTYTIDQNPIKNWDQKRQHWLTHHPSLAQPDRILMITGSQPGPCKSPVGDHLLLRFFKNKVDYCRIHGHDIFYNNALLHPKMTTFWAKLPAVRSAMVAHPEAEWIWWVDSDAAFTDMDFKLPLNRYRNHNLVVHGWPNLVYQNHSWVSLNAGVFLIRNCQWSIDFINVWAGMGPQTPNYAQWSKAQKAILPDKLYPEADDQSGLVYLLLEQNQKWGDRIYLENEFYFEGYWKEIVGSLRNVSEKYLEIERSVGGSELRRRRAEKAREYYGEVREKVLGEFGRGGLRRPFVTHFTGCEPCSGHHNEIYSRESCWEGMESVLNFADDQVLRSFGFGRTHLLDSSSVDPLPFDYPA